MPRYSFTTMASPAWDGETAIRKAREFGYQGVDLRISDHLGELKLTSTAAEVKELKKIFKEEGIMSSSLLSYNTQATADPLSWAALEETVLKNLELGTKLGTKLVRIFIGNPEISNDRTAFLDRAAGALKRVLKKDGSATSLIIQNHTGGVGIRDILEIMKLVKNPRLNMVLCPANASCMQEEFLELLPALKESLPQLYIADLLEEKNKKNWHKKTALPGKGYIDYKSIYKELGGNNFKGWISFKWEKIWNPELPGPEVALPHFIGYIKKLTGK